MRKTIHFVNADSFPRDNRPAVVILQISKKDILACNISSALKRLLILSDSAESYRAYKESLMIQVDGYTSDMRELPEIPEVRDYLSRLVREWPYFLWFLARQTGQISLLMSLLCQVRIVRSPGRPEFGIQIVETEESIASAAAEL